MVNWHDPALLLKDYITFIKLNHAIAGAYICETVLTAGFELDVIRKKRPYKWTIWLYLGTRYTGLLAFIFFFIDVDGLRVDCQPFMITEFALPYACWAFASFIIVLRIIAIWNRDIIVSLIAVGIWSGGLALHIRSLTMVASLYNPVVNACIILHTHRGLVNALGVLVVDVVLLFTMMVGLLRHAHRDSNGIWKLLYQQCIIWLALASFAEIPPVVLLILNLNDVWNQMLTAPAIAILSISAARMYRSLSSHGSFTEYVSADLPQFSQRMPNSTAQRRWASVYGPMRSASITHSEETRTAFYTSAGQIQVEMESISNGSTSSLAEENAQVQLGQFSPIQMKECGAFPRLFWFSATAHFNPDIHREQSERLVLLFLPLHNSSQPLTLPCPLLCLLPMS